MDRIRNVTMAAALLAGGTLVGAGTLGVLAAPGPSVTSPGSDLDADNHAGAVGEKATANDAETAAEKGVDDGAVDNVDVQENQTGDNQTGPTGDTADAAGDKADAAGDKADPAGDKNDGTAPAAAAGTQGSN